MYIEENGALTHELVDGGALRGLPPGAADVYLALLVRASEGAGRFRGSPRLIARLTGLGAEAVEWLLAVLVAAGLVKREEVRTAKRKRTDYLIRDPAGVIDDLRI